ncbi:MAG: hypothetical protein HQL33_02815 [Alphaproteobacteria bacterium]|nr:hypothetical protein [Alphaproteobacteria bacterium]
MSSISPVTDVVRGASIRPPVFSTLHGMEEGSTVARTKEESARHGAMLGMVGGGEKKEDGRLEKTLASLQAARTHRGSVVDIEV